MSLMQKLVAGFVVFGLGSSTAFAQESAESETREVVYQKRTEIDFDDVDVSGELKKPSGALVLDQRRAEFNPLLRFREDFDAEMRASIDEVK